MFRDDSIAGSWTGLCDRLDRTSTLRGWAVTEPDLSGIGSVRDLPVLTGAGANLDCADAVLGALLRVASDRSAGAQPGGDDAVLVLLHLLSPGVTRLADQLADLTKDPVRLVVGELTLRICAFGVGPRGGCRRRAYAANLLRDTQVAVLRELRPHATPKRPDDADLLIDPTDVEQVSAVLDAAVPGPGDGETAEGELAALLDWAQRSGVASGQDLAALVDGERSRERRAGSEPQTAIARRLGMHQMTLRRRRDRALSALRAAAGDYLRSQAA